MYAAAQMRLIRGLPKKEENGGLNFFQSFAKSATDATKYGIFYDYRKLQARLGSRS